MESLLFPIEPELPQGFSYFPDFITEDEEAELFGIVSLLQLHNLIFQGYTAKRKVVNYGYDYNFDKRSIIRGKAIPPNLVSLLDKISEWLSLSTDAIAEVLITEYPPGAVINWHRDAPPFDIIIGISFYLIATLGSGRMRKQNKAVNLSYH